MNLFKSSYFCDPLILFSTTFSTFLVLYFVLVVFYLTNSVDNHNPYQILDQLCGMEDINHEEEFINYRYSSQELCDLHIPRILGTSHILEIK